MRKLLILLLSVICLCFGTNEIKLNSVDKFSYEYYYQDGTYHEERLVDEHSLLELNLVIEDGKISYLDLDRTSKSNIFKISSDHKLYYYVNGLEDVIPSSYRFLVDLNDFKTLDLDFDLQAISTNDLVVGLDSDKIRDLSSYDTYLYQSIIDPKYQEDVTKLSDFVKEKNTINALSVDEDYNILNFKTNYNLEDEISLVKEVLNSLKLDNSTKEDNFLDTKSNTYGIYLPGNHTSIVPNFRDNKLVLNVVKYYVNPNGKLAFFNLDEIVNNKGIYSLRSSLDEEYKLENEKLARQIITNQSISSFSLKTVDGKVLDLKEDKLSDYDTLYFNNIDYLDNAKYLYLGINASLNGSVRDLVLKDGVHYTSVDNMMMTLVVENGKVVDMTIDETFKWDNAKVLIYDEKDEEYKAYLLYVFSDATKKENVDPDDNEPFNEDGERNFNVTKRVIYGDGKSFFYPGGMPVTFDKTYIDEEATLVSIYGNLTKQNSLIYDNINEVNYASDIEKLIEFFLETKNPYSLNILSDGTTDTLDIDIAVANYQNLFSSAYLEATSTDNIFNTKEAKGEKRVKFGTDVKDGRYYGIGSFSSTDEGFYTLTLTVKDNQVESIVFDETYDNYGVLTTKNSLKNDYYFDQDLEEGFRDNYKSYYEVSKKLSNEIFKSDFIEKEFNKALVNYDFSTDAKPYKIDYLVPSMGLDSDLVKYLNNYLNAIENIINQMLVQVHTDKISKIDELLTKVSEEKVLISSEKLNEAYLDLSDYLTINLNKDITDKQALLEEVPEIPSVELKIRSNDSTLRASLADDGKLYFIYDDDLDYSVLASLEVTYKFDKFSDITRVYDFKIVPEKAYLNSILKSDELKFSSNESILDDTKDTKTNLNVLEDVSTTLYTNLVNLLNEGTISYSDTKNGSPLVLKDVFKLTGVEEDNKITKTFTKEDEEVLIYFDLNDSKNKDKEDVTRSYEFNVLSLGDIKKINKNYKPGLLDSKLVNGTYDLAVGLDRLVMVNGLDYSFVNENNNVIADNKLVLNNALDHNVVVKVKLKLGEDILEEYDFINLVKTSKEKELETLSKDKTDYIFIDEEGGVIIPNLTNTNEASWYYDGKKIIDGYLDLSYLTYLPKSLTSVKLDYLYDDGTYKNSSVVEYIIVNDFNYQIN